MSTNGILTVFAGNRTRGFGGDGGPATNCSLALPQGVATDGFGNVFIADTYNQRVRKINTNGIITTVAGKGVAGFAGNQGAATNAELDMPAQVAVDALGDLFIADTQNNCIREVGTNGIINTSGRKGLSAANGVPATNTYLDQPTGCGLDAAADLFIAVMDSTIRKVANTQAPALMMNDVMMSNAGDYQLIVSSAYGSVTSVVAVLTVTQALSTIAWPSPAPITYGTALGTNESVRRNGGYSRKFCLLSTAWHNSSTRAQNALFAVFTPGDK